MAEIPMTVFDWTIRGLILVMPLRTIYTQSPAPPNSNLLEFISYKSFFFQPASHLYYISQANTNLPFIRIGLFKNAQS